jgi:hypothetical protein
MSPRIVRAVLFLLVVASPVLGVERTWKNTDNGAGGPWTDPDLWIPQGVPEPDDDLRITTPGVYSCFTNGSFTPRTLIAGGGNGARELEVSAGTTLAPRLMAEFTTNMTVTVRGTLSGTGEIIVTDRSALLMRPGSALTGPGPFFSRVGAGVIFENSQISQRGLMLAGSTDFNGVTTFSQGSTITNLGNAVLSGSLARGDSSTLLFDNRGELGVQGAASVGIDVTNSGVVTVQSGTLNISTASYKQTGGKTTIASGATLAGPVDIGAGTLGGSGTISGNVSNGGTVALATPTTFAAMQVNGNFTQTPSGTLEIKIGGVNQFDRLLISGIASLAGRISIKFVQGYVPAIGAQFPILTFGSRSGDFSFYDGAEQGEVEMVPVYGPNGLSLVAQVKAACTEGRLCLNQGRFEVSLSATDPRTGATGAGKPVRQNDIFGYFSIPSLTFDPSNPEVFVKILDGRGVNGKFWVFYGSLTDFEFTLTVFDTDTQQTKNYTKPAGEACGKYDVGAFGVGDSFAIASAGVLSTELHAMRLGREPAGLDAPVPSPDVGCVTTETSLCLLQSRFSVTLAARDQRTDRTATGRTIPRNELFGYFALPELTGDPNNVEVFVKILDGRGVNGRFWVFFGGLTDLEYTLTVRDAGTAAEKRYVKDAGSACGKFDTEAF